MTARTQDRKAIAAVCGRGGIGCYCCGEPKGSVARRREFRRVRRQEKQRDLDERLGHLEFEMTRCKWPLTGSVVRFLEVVDRDLQDRVEQQIYDEQLWEHWDSYDDYSYGPADHDELMQVDFLSSVRFTI